MHGKIKTVNISAGTPGTITLLQKGVAIRATAGMNIRDFMIKTLGFSPDYAENKVRTVFLNSSPVDDIDGIRIKDGDTLSLSGAMPGVCGIAMGRDTPVSGFRNDISATATDDNIEEAEALIYVKLFNLVARDAGSVLLKKGVMVEAVDIINALKENSPAGLSPDDGIVILKF
ncbi:hypothetical protein [Maridesulfovibrio hydrothermalis]|uniref:Uncharacterized protein n=1 Tax=Maridesulfovibrio hydrothermalis AM13 = DSM 14728 TaxID=1121451 RepID=L0R8F0_9BACT|nr:hypothetical protein [Maridesulfovibrio hydrothermalis]CCO22450.1 conserved protein of unknown function [Maridesulfovibrio hydrothermalis AM13 = DSM 14728]